MYITEHEGHFCCSALQEGAVAQLLPPILIENGEQTSLEVSEMGTDEAVYVGARDRVSVQVKQIEDGVFRITRRWVNTAAETRSIRTVLRVAACFVVEKFLVPGVNVNGNEFGAGGEPKGLTHDGSPWVFSYDRMGIPACTLTENAQMSLSLFASAKDSRSLVSAGSVHRDEQTGTFYQELYHPVAETPVAYSKRDAFTEGYADEITLRGGESFEIEAFVIVGAPRWESYGICKTLDVALSLFPPVTPTSLPTNRQLWDRSIVFAQSLIKYYKDKKAFHIGFLPDGKGGFAYRSDDSFQLAWCGQNVLLCRMFIEDYIRNDDREKLDTALEILDTRVDSCISSCGLIAQQLRFSDDLEHTASDTCNLGYGAYEFLRVYEKLRAIGMDKPSYLAAGLGVCDFFLDHFSPEYGFGKLWRHDGVCLETGGTIGAFLIPALVKAYSLTQKADYLALAKQAMDFYMTRDLDHFVSTAGALDTCCVDKETSAPLIMAGVMLYDVTGEDKYLEQAQRAAYYFTSWMYHYQPYYDENTEIARYGVCVRGLTSVSAQHHHVDMYGALVVPYLRMLADRCGDEKWRERADVMWRAVLQFIGDGELEIHGVVRPVGSQNEAVFQCPWSFGWEGATFPRGALNDWLVAWPCAFRLSVLEGEKYE